MPGRRLHDDEVDDRLTCCRPSDDGFVARLSPCMSSEGENYGDFLPCKPIDEDNNDDEDAQSNQSVVAGVWSHLPEDLLFMILAWLPSRSILRFRYVCKRWKCLFASPTFHHFASHQTQVPAWIFISGKSNNIWAKLEVFPSRRYESRDDDHAMAFADTRHANRVDDREDRFGKEYVKRDDNFEGTNVNGDGNYEGRHDDDDYVVGYGGIDSSTDDDDERYTYAKDGSSANGDWANRNKHSPSNLPFADASQEVNKGNVDAGVPGYTHSFGYDHIQGAADVDDSRQVNGYSSECQGEGWSFQLSSKDRDNATDSFDGKGSRNNNHNDYHDIGNEDLSNGYFRRKDQDCYVRGWDKHGICHANVDVGGKQEAVEKLISYKNSDDLLLIFDCESRTWFRPLPTPAVIKGLQLDDHCIRSIICSLRGHILIPAGVPCRIYIENPVALSCQDLPSFSSIQGAPHALGLAEEKTTLHTATNLQMSMQFSELKDVPSQDLHSNPFIQSIFQQDHTGKDFQVIAIGETCNGTLVLEMFNSSMGSWHVGAIFPSNFIFYQTKLGKCDSKKAYQTRIVECNGSFFALLGRPDALVLMKSVKAGYDIEWSLRDLPWPPTPDGVFRVHLWESSLVACRNSVFLIGASKTYIDNENYRHDEYFWGVHIWRFLPQFLDDSCWQLLVAMPHRIFEEFYGMTSYLTPECLAHDDVIFFQDPNSRRILMYDVTQNTWTFSQECEHDIQSMVCLWEPLIIN